MYNTTNMLLFFSLSFFLFACFCSCFAFPFFGELIIHVFAFFFGCFTGFLGSCFAKDAGGMSTVSAPSYKMVLS